MKSNWQTKTLGEIFLIERGGSPRPIKSYLTTNKDGINWIKIGDTKNVSKYIYKTQEKIKPEGLKKSRLVRKGDFILSNSMSFGRPYLMKTTGAIHDGWLVLREKLPGIDKDFFYYLLSSPIVYQQFDRLAAGSTVRNLNTKLVGNVAVLFPPISEQKRIVKILDEVFEKTAKAKENTEKNLQNSSELFESSSDQVFSGKKWSEKRLGSLCKKITKGSSPKWQGIKYVDKPGTLFITSENVGNNALILDNRKYVEERFNTKDKKSILQHGDVLTNIVGASIGRTAIYTLKDIANINQAVCILRCDSKVLDNTYLTHLLNSPFLRKILHDNEVNTARANLSLGFFSNLPIPLPTLSEQKTIVNKLDTLLASSKKLADIYERKLTDLVEFKKSILKMAFTNSL
jgi:type I restriction enzyme S subunit